MYVTTAIEMTGSPLEHWRRIATRDGEALRTVARRVATQAGAFRTLLGFRQPGERPRAVTFDCEMRPLVEPGGAVFMVWDAGLARLEGVLEVVPTGTTYELRLSASYDPPWGASATTDRSVLLRMAEAAVEDFLHTVERTVLTSSDTERTVQRRVLVEDEDLAWHRVLASLATDEDTEFDGCPGPAFVAGGCPVLRGEACSKVEWANTIFHSLDGDRPDNALLLERLRNQWPDAAATMLPADRPTHCLIR